MPATVETQPEGRRLEDELHQLEESEAALERRADSLALTNVLSLVFAFFAVAISVVAILVAVVADDDDGDSAAQVADGNGVAQVPAGNGVVQERGPAGSSGPAMAGGMVRDRTAGDPTQAGVRKLRVRLGEMWVRPQYRSVSAGKVTFVVRNTGQVEHELMVERAPLKMEAPGMPDHDAAQAATEHLAPGEGARLTVRLAPGEYVLFCNVPGHYAAGQHTRFTVTKG